MKKLIILILCLIMGACSLSNEHEIPENYKGLTAFEVKHTLDINSNYTYYETRDKKSRYYYLPFDENGRNYIYNLESVPGKYVVLTGNNYTKRELKSDERGGTGILPTNAFYDYSEYTLRILDLPTGKKLRDIDVKEIVDENFKEYEINGNINVPNPASIERDGRYYQPIILSKRPKEVKPSQLMDVAVLLVDVENGKYKLSNQPYIDYLDNYWYKIKDPYRIISGDGLYSLGTVNGISMDLLFPKAWENSEFEHTIKITTSTYKLPRNNAKLYSMFPELKEVRQIPPGDGYDKDISFELDIRDFPTWQDLLKLFLEDDQEITFEGWTYDSVEAYVEDNVILRTYEVRLAELMQEVEEIKNRKDK